MQRVFIGALCRQMSSCNQSERDAIFGRVSYERKLNNHHDQGRRQGATAIIEFFSVTHASKNVEGARGACVRRRGGGACAMAQWHNGQSKPDKIPPRMHQKLTIFRSKTNNKILGRGHSTSDCGRNPASFLDHFKHWIDWTVCLRNGKR